MQTVDLREIELVEQESALIDDFKIRFAFPSHAATGSAASATVYFELEPGMRLATHQDSAEEILYVIEGEGEATVGDETARLGAGQLAVVPSNEPHGIRNVGDGVLRVLGFFAGSSSIAVFEEPFAPGGPQVIGIGAPVELAAPLAETAAA
jgi:quercetin dioxygenase-like cupin family protein